MILQSYTLLVNGAECAVQIEAAEQITLPEAAPASPVTAVSNTEKPAAVSRAPQAFPARAASYQPTQAAWVTARRVAHLPFH